MSYAKASDASSGLARPQGKGCDIGAVAYVAQEEVVIVVTRKVYLPVVAR